MELNGQVACHRKSREPRLDRLYIQEVVEQVRGNAKRLLDLVRSQLGNCNVIKLREHEARARDLRSRFRSSRIDRRHHRILHVLADRVCVNRRKGDREVLTESRTIELSSPRGSWHQPTLENAQCLISPAFRCGRAIIRPPPFNRFNQEVADSRVLHRLASHLTGCDITDNLKDDDDDRDDDDKWDENGRHGPAPFRSAFRWLHHKVGYTVPFPNASACLRNPAKASTLMKSHGVERTAMGAPEKYVAFISYKHAELDRRVSKTVHRFLETFRVPRPLRDDGAPSKLGAVFRDDEELSASPSLPASIEQALAESRWLIVVCTPAAARSNWVNRETDAFIQMHGRERVLTVLAAGEPNESFPNSLRNDGSNTVEPLACDLRNARKHFTRRRELLRLVAPILGCDYDELVQRHRRRRIRMVAAALATASVVLCALLAISWSNMQESRIAESRALAAQSRELLADGNRIEAIETALDALPPSEAGPLDRPYVDEAQGALADALGVYPSQTPYPYQLRPCYERQIPGRIEDIVISSDATAIAVRDAGSTIDVIDASSGSLLCSLSPDPETVLTSPELVRPMTQLVPSFTGDLALSDSRLLIGFTYIHTLCFDIKTGEIAWSAPDSVSSGYAISHSGDMAAIASRKASEDGEADTLLLLAADNGDPLAEVSLPCDLPDQSNPCFSLDDSLVFIPCADTLVVVDIEKQSAHKLTWDLGDDASVFEFDSMLVAASTPSEQDGSCAITALDRDGSSTLWEARIPSGSISENYSALFGEPIIPFASETICLVISGTSVAALNASSGEVLATLPLPDIAVDAAPIASPPFEDHTPVVVTLANGQRFLFAYLNNRLAALEMEGLDAVRLSASVACGTRNLPSYIQATSSTDDGSMLQVRKLTAVGSGEDYEPLASGQSVIYTDADASHLLLPTANGTDGSFSLAVYDAQTLESIRTIDLAGLGITVPLARVASHHPHLLVFPQTGGSGDLTISTVDVEQGKLIAQRTWQDDERASLATDPAFNLLCVSRGKTLELLDEQTLETVATYRDLPIEDPGIAAAIASEKTVAVIRGQYADGEPNLDLLDRETGALMDGTDISSYSVSTSGDSTALVLADEDRHAPILSCQDGMLRSFDIYTGDLIWEQSTNVSSGGRLAMSADGMTLLVQESTARIIALDAATGQIRGTCEDVPGELNHIVPTSDTDVMQCYYSVTHDGGSYSHGVATIHIASDGLHVRDTIPYALYLSEPAGRVMISCSGILGTISYYDCDDLRALGEEILREYGSEK